MYTYQGCVSRIQLVLLLVEHFGLIGISYEEGCRWRNRGLGGSTAEKGVSNFGYDTFRKTGGVVKLSRFRKQRVGVIL
jgi:hypothetical protein